MNWDDRDVDWDEDRRRRAQDDADERDAIEQLRVERLLDHTPGLDSTRARCVVCGERPGVGVYGGACLPCFEARRAEREEAEW